MINNVLMYIQIIIHVFVRIVHQVYKKTIKFISNLFLMFVRWDPLWCDIRTLLHCRSNRKPEAVHCAVRILEHLFFYTLEKLVGRPFVHDDVISTGAG